MLQVNDNERAWLAFSRGLPNGGYPKLKDIMAAVALHTGVSIMEIKGGRKQLKAVRARHIYCYLARLMTVQSFPQIGASINRDHTSIIHAVCSIERKLSENVPGLSEDIEAIKALIYTFSESNT